MYKRFLLALLLLSGCVAGSMQTDSTLRLSITNYNWERSKVTLQCRGHNVLPTHRIDFNAKVTEVYKKFTCADVSVVVDLMPSHRVWTSPTVLVQEDDTLCLIIFPNLRNSTFFPCRY